jgi:uncharacterized protein YxeA
MPKKPMKNLSLASALIIALSISLFSCKKENNKTSTTYIKGKKDGTAFNFTTNSMAKITDFTSSGGFTSLNLLANGNALEGFNLGINFFNGTAIQTGSFSEDNAGSDYIVAGVYNPNSTTTVNAAGIQSPSAKPLVINILTKTSTEITGTFEGAFYRQDITTGTSYSDYILISEGEFKLQIQ